MGGILAALVAVRRHQLPLSALVPLARRWAPGAVFGAYLGLSGLSRPLVKYLRTNGPVVPGLTQPQLWALASIAVGCVLITRHRTAPRRSTAEETEEAPADLTVR